MDTYINIKQVENELKRLKIPQEYNYINPWEIFNHEYSFYVSVRECGKTTNALLIGLVLYKLYGTKTEYLRCDDDQIKRAQIEELYGTVKGCGYIEKIFPKMWNDIEYSQVKKCFYLIARDGEGAVIKKDTTPFCAVHSNEKWQKLKSSYNSPKGDYILVDELMDSTRQTINQMTELMNNISTIGRVNSPQRCNNVHIVLLSNNTNPFSFWWEEFEIADRVKELKDFGETFEHETSLGVKIFFKSIELAKDTKKKIERKKIPFFGFNTRKMAQFNGMQVWAGLDYPHIPDPEMLDPKKKIFEYFYIYHRNRYIKLNLYYSRENQYYVFLHFANEPKLKDRVIFTLNPLKENEIYGFGNYSDAIKVNDNMRKLLRLKKENRWYYENNQIGRIIDDYCKDAQ